MQDIAIGIPAQCIAQESLITETFNGMTVSVKDYCSRVILCPKNAKTLATHKQVLQQLPGDCHTYVSAMCDNEEEAANYPPEFLHSLTPSGMPTHILNLKAGAMVMLPRNLNIKEGNVKQVVHHLNPLPVIDACISDNIYTSFTENC